MAWATRHGLFRRAQETQHDLESRRASSMQASAAARERTRSRTTYTPQHYSTGCTKAGPRPRKVREARGGGPIRAATRGYPARTRERVITGGGHHETQSMLSPSVSGLSEVGGQDSRRESWGTMYIPMKPSRHISCSFLNDTGAEGTRPRSHAKFHLPTRTFPPSGR